jgi:hypothetical protein
MKKKSFAPHFFVGLARRKEGKIKAIYIFFLSEHFCFLPQNNMNARRRKVGLNLRLQRKIYVCVKGAKGDMEKN